jgi:hypothetical protein
VKIQTYSELYPESLTELNKDYEEDIASLTRSINQVGRNLNQLSSRNISLTDNMYCDTRDLVITGGAALIVKNNFPVPPKVILVGRVKLAKPTDPALTSAVQVLDWSAEEANITLTSVVGLTVGQKYNITLIILY